MLSFDKKFNKLIGKFIEFKLKDRVVTFNQDNVEPEKSLPDSIKHGYEELLKRVFVSDPVTSVPLGPGSDLLTSIEELLTQAPAATSVVEKTSATGTSAAAIEPGSVLLTSIEELLTQATTQPPVSGEGVTLTGQCSVLLTSIEELLTQATTSAAAIEPGSDLLTSIEELLTQATTQSPVSGEGVTQLAATSVAAIGPGSDLLTSIEEILTQTSKQPPVAEKTGETAEQKEQAASTNASSTTDNVIITTIEGDDPTKKQTAYLNYDTDERKIVSTDNPKTETQTSSNNNITSP